jgi:hypothetical protein
MREETVGHLPKGVLRALREWRASERELDPSYSDGTRNGPLHRLRVQPARNSADEDDIAPQLLI